MLEDNSSPPTRYLPTISQKTEFSLKAAHIVPSFRPMAQENPMPMQNNINDPTTLTYNRYNFLQSSSQLLPPQDNPPCCHLNVTTLRMALLGPIPSQHIMTTDTTRLHVEDNLSRNFTPAAHRKAYLDKAIISPHASLQNPTSRKHDQDE